MKVTIILSILAESGIISVLPVYFLRLNIIDMVSRNLHVDKSRKHVLGQIWHVRTAQSAQDKGPMEHEGANQCDDFCLTVRITVFDVEVEVEDNIFLNHFHIII